MQTAPLNTETFPEDKMKNDFPLQWKQLLRCKFSSDANVQGWESNATVYMFGVLLFFVFSLFIKISNKISSQFKCFYLSSVI